MKLLIISHTAHYQNLQGEIVGWGPTIREINYLSEIFSKVYHIAPLYKDVNAPDSSDIYNQNVEFIPIKPSGGKGLQKLTIFSTSWDTLKKVNHFLTKVDYVHFRAPTGIGIVVLPFLKIFNNKKLWVKYAGNWIDKNMPIGNRLQKWWLENMISYKDLVTVNGQWNSQNKNILSFENPCLTEEDRSKGALIINKKELASKLKFCFVGALTENKGVHLILEVLKELKNTNIAEFHFVGGGKDIEKYRRISNNIEIKCVFHDFLSKTELIEIYSACHFLILPSKNEGFPKVVSESMNYGCIPIVSDVSALNQYITDEENGYLINSPVTMDGIKNKIEKALSIDSKSYIKNIKNNYTLAERFTYKKYLDELKKYFLFINE